LNANGTITYTPAAGFVGTNTITYEVSDGCGGFDTAVVTVTVTNPNTPPDARNDSASTHCGVPVTVSVLANDTDANGNTLTITRIVSGPAFGSVSINSNGTITFNPGATTGVATFSYEISDGCGGTDIATVSVTVTNTAPVAQNDAVTINAGPVTIAVLGNDYDPDGDRFSITGYNQPSQGVVQNNGNGTFTYTPLPWFTGTDSFTYTITDDCGLSSTARVYITVLTCPLVLDLDGNGLNLLALNDSAAMFDMDGNGTTEHTAWVGSGDGLLAFDADGNGRIEGINELFGGQGTDGFSDLRTTMDSNADGIVNALDANFGSLRVWVDADSDGTSDDGELMLLADFGITGVNLDGTFIDQHENGQWVSDQGTFTYADGSVGGIYDVWFENDNSAAALSNIQSSAERLNLSNGEADSVVLTAADLLAMGGDNPIIINGDAGDDISLEGSFAQIATVDMDGMSYGVFSDGALNTLIQAGLSVNGEAVS
ncbi:MAG: Ig-like domain-containing protein, partial [Alphaproteobacteria bacterium]